jgi:hypothetical protein
MKVGRRKGVKSVLVEPYLQVKLGLMFLILNLVFAILIFSVYGYYIWDIYSTLSSYFSMHELNLDKFAWPVIAGISLIIFFVASTLFISVKYTHKIYGPLVSIHRFLDSWIKGQQPERLHIRESDQLQELALKLNSLAEAHAPTRKGSPLVAVHRYLDQLLEGEGKEPLKARESDNLDTLVEKLNLIAEKLRREG